MEKILKLISKFFKRIQKIEIKFTLPPCKKILIYDREGSLFIAKYFEEKDYYILDVRKESLYLFIYIKTLLKGEISYKSYLDTFIEHVNPTVLLTLIDNNPNFYLLKKKFPNLFTAFIQNGTRGEIGDVFGNVSLDPDFQVDYMFVHGRAIGKKYESLIKGKSIPIGSFKNNMVEVKIQPQKKEKTILFTSTFILPPDKDDVPIWIEKNGQPTYWSQFYESESIILPFLKNFCHQHGIHLQICGRLFDGNVEEKQYYSKFLDGCNWSFLERVGTFSSYTYADEADLIVNIDSTLGYEAFGRGKKVAFFTIRGKSLNSSATRFGWPGEYPDEGPFWTNNASTDSFRRILDSLLEMDAKIWEEISRLIKSEVMHYDMNNCMFQDVLFQFVGISLLEKT